MNVIHVLHVVGIMNRGGIETFIMNVYRNINRNKVQFDFLVHKDEVGDYDKEILALGGKIYKIPYVNKVGPIKYPRILYNFFKEHSEYNIVHSHMNLVSGVILKEAKNAGVKYTIAHGHSTNDMGRFYERFYKKLVGTYLNKYSDYKFACSREAANYIFKEEGSKDCIIIKNGVDLSKFKVTNADVMKVKKEMNIKDNSLVIGNVARFSQVKNHKFLIDVFYEISRKNENAILVLVGDGELKQDIVDKVNKYGIEDKVIFTGIREDIPCIMKMFNVFILPSFFEGLGIVLIEAQACGIKCIVSKNITKEADMNMGLLTYLDINDSINMWADEAIRPYSHPDNTLRNIESLGYDIKKVASFIEDFYENLNVSR